MTHPDTEPLLVSFCIPTFNRSRYLQSLLESLVGQLNGFPYRFELVIADNASPDATPDVVAAFADRLPIRYLRHDTNIGGYPNWQFVMSQATGRYLVYLSDDDSLLGDQVAATIAKMEADPEIVVVYAPWLLYDLVEQREQGQFYTVPRDLRIERGAARACCSITSFATTSSRRSRSPDAMRSRPPCRASTSTPFSPSCTPPTT